MCVLPLSGKLLKLMRAASLNTVTWAGSIDFLSISHTDKPCSHPRASASAVPSAWNALLMAVGKACSFPLPKFQQKHHLFGELSQWAPTYYFYLMTMLISFPEPTTVNNWLLECLLLCGLSPQETLSSMEAGTLCSLFSVPRPWPTTISWTYYHVDA